MPQQITNTAAGSALHVEMEAQEDGAPIRRLWYKPMAWPGVLCPLLQAESWTAPLWLADLLHHIQRFPVPLITTLPSVTCG